MTMLCLCLHGRALVEIQPVLLDVDAISAQHEDDASSSDDERHDDIFNGNALTDGNIAGSELSTGGSSEATAAAGLYAGNSTCNGSHADMSQYLHVHNTTAHKQYHRLLLHVAEYATVVAGTEQLIADSFVRLWSAAHEAGVQSASVVSLRCWHTLPDAEFDHASVKAHISQCCVDYQSMLDDITKGNVPCVQFVPVISATSSAYEHNCCAVWELLAC